MEVEPYEVDRVSEGVLTEIRRVPAGPAADTCPEVEEEIATLRGLPACVPFSMKGDRQSDAVAPPPGAA